MHVGANCFTDAITLATHAQATEAATASALAPSYFKPRDVTALIACCAPVAAAAPALPFYYYDIPALTGVSLPMAEFLEKTRQEIPTFAGIKYTNPDTAQLQLCLDLKWGELAWGVDEALLAALALGVRSAVGSTYNFAAPVAQRLVRAFDRGDRDLARLEQLRLVRLVAVLARHGYLPAAKHLMERLGVAVGPARVPLARLGPVEVKTLDAELDQLGFRDWLAPEPPGSRGTPPSAPEAQHSEPTAI